MGLWNRLARHQNGNAPFRMLRVDAPETREGLANIAAIRREEVIGFIEGMFWKKQGLALPETHLRHLPNTPNCVRSIPRRTSRGSRRSDRHWARRRSSWSTSIARGARPSIQTGRALEAYNLYWIEEPVATDDVDGSARVADALATPIAGYETEIGLSGFRELITRGAVDIVQPDLAWAGGFSECRRIAALARAHHLITVSPGRLQQRPFTRSASRGRHSASW